MKALLVLLTSFAFAASALHAGTNSFEEFKSLLENDRKVLIANANDPLWSKYMSWLSRLQMGEKIWNQNEMRRLGMANGNSHLISLFIDYQHIEEEFSVEDWHRKKATISSDNLVSESVRWSEHFKAIQDQFDEAIRTISALPKTSEVENLNEQDSKLDAIWAKRFPQGSDFIITPAQMDTVIREIAQIILLLNKIHKKTTQQVQSELDRLPSEPFR